MHRKQRGTVTKLADRVSATLSRVVRAWDRAWQLISESRHLRQTSADLRRDKPQLETFGAVISTDPSGPNSSGAPHVDPRKSLDDCVIWKSDDGAIVCCVIPHVSDNHEVTITVHGRMLNAFNFADPVEATDEAERLRKLFIG